MKERTCALCSITLPEFNKDGKHNFVPHVLDGEIKNLCMKCKMRFVTSSRSWTNNIIR